MRGRRREAGRDSEEVSQRKRGISMRGRGKDAGRESAEV